jgi:hypothetical protein
MNSTPENLHDQLAYEVVRHFEGASDQMRAGFIFPENAHQAMGALLAEAVAHTEIDVSHHLEQLDAQPIDQAISLADAFERVDTEGADRLKQAAERLNPELFEPQDQVLILAGAQRAAVNHGVEPLWHGFRIDPVATLEEFTQNDDISLKNVAALYACDLYYPWDDPDTEPVKELLDTTVQYIDTEAAQEPSFRIAWSTEANASTMGEFISLGALKGFHEAGREAERGKMVKALLERPQYGGVLPEFVGSLYEAGDPEADMLYQTIAEHKQDLAYGDEMELRRAYGLVARGELDTALAIAEEMHRFKDRAAIMTSVALEQGRRSDLSAAESLLKEVAELDPNEVELAIELDIEQDTDTCEVGSVDERLVSALSALQAKASTTDVDGRFDREKRDSLSAVAMAAAELGLYPMAVSSYARGGSGLVQRVGQSKPLLVSPDKTIARFAAERQETAQLVDEILANEDLEIKDRLELVMHTLEAFNQQRVLHKPTDEQADVAQKTLDFVETAGHGVIFNEGGHEENAVTAIRIESGQRPAIVDQDTFGIPKSQAMSRFLIYLARTGQTEEIRSMAEASWTTDIFIRDSIATEMLQVGLAQVDDAMLREASDYIHPDALSYRLAKVNYSAGSDLPPAPDWLINKAFAKGHRDLRLVRGLLLNTEV